MLINFIEYGISIQISYNIRLAVTNFYLFDFIYLFFNTCFRIYSFVYIYINNYMKSKI